MLWESWLLFFRKKWRQCEGAASASGSIRQVSLQLNKGAKRIGAWAETLVMKDSTQARTTEQVWWQFPESAQGLAVARQVCRDEASLRPGPEVGVLGSSVYTGRHRHPCRVASARTKKLRWGFSHSSLPGPLWMCSGCTVSELALGTGSQSPRTGEGAAEPCDALGTEQDGCFVSH